MICHGKVEKRPKVVKYGSVCFSAFKTLHWSLLRTFIAIRGRMRCPPPPGAVKDGEIAGAARVTGACPCGASLPECGEVDIGALSQREQRPKVTSADRRRELGTKRSQLSNQTAQRCHTVTNTESLTGQSLSHITIRSTSRIYRWCTDS